MNSSGFRKRNNDGKRFVLRADEKLTAFIELESEIRPWGRTASEVSQKPPTHQGGGFNPPAEIYLVSFPTTHRRELSSPIKGTLALHCQVARLVSEFNRAFISRRFPPFVS